MSSLKAQFVELKHRWHRLKDELEEVERGLSGLEAKIVEEMAMEGEENIRLNGMTLYTKTFLRARVKPELSPEQVKAAFADPEWSDLVRQTVNAQSLAARIKEAKENDRPVPESVLQAAEVFEGVGLGTRR